MYSKFRNAALFFIFSLSPLFSTDEVYEKIVRGCPKWMNEQISKDLEPFQNQTFSYKALKQRSLQMPTDFFVVKFTIKNNSVFAEKESLELPEMKMRASVYERALEDLAKITKLPDIVFYIALLDGYNHYFARLNNSFPVFLMSRTHSDENPSILIPDFEGLNEKYQILENEDIVNFKRPWNLKKPVLMWRGTVRQCAYDFFTYVGPFFRENKTHKFTRITLCELSNKFPKLIDAKFTGSKENEEIKIWPFLKSYYGEKISYKKQCDYKYHILIHGYASSYSNSGWRFFINSVVFLPNSGWEQWYDGALKPYVHYIPVERRLEDLVEKIAWAKEHDSECKEIAKNAQKFARTHLTKSDHLVYLYYLLERYSQLNFVE